MISRAASYAIVLLSFIAGALIWLPASLLSLGAPYWRAAPFVPTDFAGSVWRGSARVVNVSADAGTSVPALPGRLHWQVGVTKWRPFVQFKLDCCMTQPVLVSPWYDNAKITFLLTNLDLTAPASWLQNVGAPFNTLRPQGELRLTSGQLKLSLSTSGTQATGAAKLAVNNFSSALSTIQPVGSYTLALNAQGPSITLNLNTNKGPLKLSGTGVISQGRIQFRGQAASDPQHQQALNNLLNIIGRRQGLNSTISIG